MKACNGYKIRNTAPGTCCHPVARGDLSHYTPGPLPWNDLMLSGNLTLPRQSYKWTKWALTSQAKVNRMILCFGTQILDRPLLQAPMCQNYFNPSVSEFWHFGTCTKFWIQASAPPRTICRAVVTLHCHQISMLNTILSLIAYNTSIDICIVDFSPPKCLPYLIFGFFLGYNLRDQSYQKLPPRLIEFRRQRLSTDPDMFEDKNFWTF